jgi:hypothetical protein
MDDQTLCLMCDNLIRQLLMKGNCDPGDDIPHHGKKDILSCSAAACQVCRLILGHLDREPADDLTYSISKSFTRSFTFDVMTSEGWAYCCYLCQPYSFASSDGTTSGHDVGLEGRRIILHSDSVECQELAKKWLHQCLQHPKCHRKEHTMLPTRVIDVGSQGTSQHPKLLTTHGRTGSYVTLSYCWGGTVPLQLRRHSQPIFELGIPLESMPRTFSDAIKVVRALGLRYLWIDALCIIQDDEADWEVEAGSMGRVYTNSLFTISATSAQNPAQGLFCRRDVDYVNLPHTYSGICGRGAPLSLGSLGDLLSTAMDKESPVRERAWILQEQILSPAVLHFTHEQLIWECRSGRFFEDGLHQEVDPFTKAALLSESRIAFNDLGDREMFEDKVLEDKYFLWYEMVRDDTRRKLSHDSDRLLAIAGLAETFSKRVQSTYLAGIWNDDLPRGLLWQGMHREMNKPIQATAQLSTPSWTWAHYAGPVSYPPPNQFINADANAGFDLEVVDTEVNVGEGSPFGNIQGGKMTVVGLLQNTVYKGQTCRFVQDCDPLISFRGDGMAEDATIKCSLLLVGTSTISMRTFFLVLIKLGDGEAKYRRIGIAFRDWQEGETYDPERFFQNAIKERIVLV